MAKITARGAQALLKLEQLSRSDPGFERRVTYVVRSDGKVLRKGENRKTEGSSWDRTWKGGSYKIVRDIATTPESIEAFKLNKTYAGFHEVRA